MMDAADVVSALNKVRRDVPWLAKRIGAPAEDVQRWIYGGEPMEDHWRLAIANALTLEGLGVPPAVLNDEPPLAVSVSIPGDKVDLIARAAALKDVPIEFYVRAAAIEMAAGDVGLDDDAGAWELP